MTKLQAANRILQVIGADGVTALTSNPTTSGNDDARAQVVLDRKLREILSTGWACNTVERTFTPSAAEVDLAGAGYLGIDASSAENAEVVWRGGKLYDTTNGTATLTGTYKLMVYELLDIDDLPPQLARYITEAAALEFYLQNNPDHSEPQRLSVLRVPVNEARANAIEEDTRQRRAGGSNELAQGVRRILLHLSRMLNDPQLETRAREQIEESRRSVLMSGWSANRAYDRAFEPDEDDGTISLSGVLSFSPSSREYRRELGKRGGKLFNSRDNTNVFSSTVYLDTIEDTAFADLPEALRRYVIDDAGYQIAMASGSRTAIAAAGVRREESMAHALRESDVSSPVDMSESESVVYGLGRPSNRYRRF